MTIYETLKKDMVDAMKAKEKEKLTVIRMVKSAMDLEHIDKKRDLDDELAIDVLTREVKTNTSIIVPKIFPILLGCFILPNDVVIVKNIKGTMITNNKFKNKSPNGLNTVALSLNISPTIVPIIIDAISINEDL